MNPTPTSSIASSPPCPAEHHGRCASCRFGSRYRKATQRPHLEELRPSALNTSIARCQRGSLPSQWKAESATTCAIPAGTRKGQHAVKNTRHGTCARRRHAAASNTGGQRHDTRRERDEQERRGDGMHDECRYASCLWKYVVAQSVPSGISVVRHDSTRCQPARFRTVARRHRRHGVEYEHGLVRVARHASAAAISRRRCLCRRACRDTSIFEISARCGWSRPRGHDLHGADDPPAASSATSRCAARSRRRRRRSSRTRRRGRRSIGNMKLTDAPPLDASISTSASVDTVLRAADAGR